MSDYRDQKQIPEATIAIGNIYQERLSEAAQTPGVNIGIEKKHQEPLSEPGTDRACAVAPSFSVKTED